MNPNAPFGAPNQPNPTQPGQLEPQPGQNYTQGYGQGQQQATTAAQYGDYGSPQYPQQSGQQNQPFTGQPQPVNYGQIPASMQPPARKKSSKVWIILAVLFLLTTLGGAGAFVWAYMNYTDQKDDVDSKITSAVGVAVKDQADKDAAAFLEKEKQPNRQFAGPDDYGRLSFDYPKTWSIYVPKDTTNGDSYEAYFNPVSVPPISSQQQYALHVTIENKDYDKVLDTYKSLVTKGDLKSSAVAADEQNGTRLDGSFNKDIKGSAVLFKIRDKTVTVRTDAQAFEGDFNALIKTITFNK